MEELEIMLKMLDVPYKNILGQVCINSNFIYIDDELEKVLKQYCILNGFDCNFSQKSIYSTEWFVIRKKKNG